MSTTTRPLNRAERRAMDRVIAGIERAIGTPRTPRFPPAVVIFGLREHLRALEVGMGREPDSSLPMIRRGVSSRRGQSERIKLEATPGNIATAVRSLQARSTGPSHLWLSGVAHVLGQMAAEYKVTLKELGYVDDGPDVVDSTAAEHTTVE